MSDTPRTDAVIARDTGDSGLIAELASECSKMERELNAANVEIDEKRKDIVYLATEKAKLEDRVKRLEEAGDAMADNFNPWTFIHWTKAKEAKL